MTAVSATSVAERLAGLDPALPNLAASFDMAAVTHALQRAWHTPVTSCRRLTTRYEPGVRCVTTYAVEGATAIEHRIGVAETTADGTRWRTWVDDDALPGLAAAVDPSTVSDLVGAPAHVDAVGYHAGERAVVRYDVETNDGRRQLFGKVLADGTARLGRTLRTLGVAAQREEGFPRVPLIVAEADELGLVVQGAAVGESLHAVAFDGDVGHVAPAFRALGRALAHLHSSDVAVPDVVTVADDVDDVQAMVAIVECVDGDLARRMSGVLRRAGDGCNGEAPTHGSLRTDQVRIDGDTVVLLDLDAFCAAHPARDIGNLFAYLRWRAVREPRHQSAVAAARAAVAEGYADNGTAFPAQEASLFEGLSLLKIAGRRFRSLAVHEWPLVPTIVAAAGELVTGAAA